MNSIVDVSSPSLQTHFVSRHELGVLVWETKTLTCDKLVRHLLTSTQRNSSGITNLKIMDTFNEVFLKVKDSPR